MRLCTDDMSPPTFISTTYVAHRLVIIWRAFLFQSDNVVLSLGHLFSAVYEPKKKEIEAAKAKQNEEHTYEVTADTVHFIATNSSVLYFII